MWDIHDPDAIKMTLPSEETKYYEVLRCIDGIPIFLEDHLDRLQASIQKTVVFDRELLENEISQLIEQDGIINGNIKIVLTQTVQLLYSSSFYYPSGEEYRSGVRVGLLQWKREDPNVKVVREDYKKAISYKLEQKGIYGSYFETLLIDTDGFITEGSRSNAFFVKGSQVFTAPDEDILKGITRKYVLKAIQAAGATLVSKKISAQKIETLKEDGAAFLSGTSIGVLPICAIEETQISSSSNKMICRIMKEYDNIIQNYLIIHKKQEE